MFYFCHWCRTLLYLAFGQNIFFRNFFSWAQSQRNATKQRNIGCYTSLVPFVNEKRYSKQPITCWSCNTFFSWVYIWNQNNENNPKCLKQLAAYIFPNCMATKPFFFFPYKTEDVTYTLAFIFPGSLASFFAIQLPIFFFFIHFGLRFTTGNERENLLEEIPCGKFLFLKG